MMTATATSTMEVERRLGVDGGPPCLVCGAATSPPFLDLGTPALANRLPEHATDCQPRFPLRVCACPGCGHVQLAGIVPPEAMFTEYLYVSSASTTLSAHFVELAKAAHQRAGLSAADLAVDIGSNDGSLLAALMALGSRVRGVDPAANLAHLARRRGVETEVAYFDASTAAGLRERHGPARLITATNSFPHIPRLHSYLEGIEQLLDDEGIFVIEAHYLADLIEQNAFDTIYHEHVSYWALSPLERLLEAHALEVFDVERLPIHHGQIRVWMARRGARQIAPSVGLLRAEEARTRLSHPETLDAFARRSGELRHQIRSAVSELRAAGVTVAGYGAPAKASTLLDYCGLGPRDIAWIADRNPFKQGRFTPGTGIPIVSPDRIAASPPGVLVLFAWNFATEIMAQLDGYRRSGGRFLIPVPRVRLV
jgi:C-methyltransferase C-terminal domain/Putative zinc binding domain/Methyltransferase domain